ncbi:hypothetical protein [Amycolatopsis albispora]|uniref:Uncharacterized protein n=1 Tax=Amycolatopsis albispora TaxID=1804986 RepID=A0A344LFN1_9PSEU|nr:hypothetical protein [Amycolatopsis albispora]AXB46855.1 hypothetical protein A4R43_34060 [Amycolatopsis albispora]
MDNDAAARFRATVQNAVTHSERVAGEAKARSDRRRAENSALAQQFRARRLAGGDPTPTSPALRAAASSFRIRNALPVENLPSAAELVPIRKRERPKPARVGDEDEDFSQERIMRRVDGTRPGEPRK